MQVDIKVIQRYLEGNEKKGDRELLLEWFSTVRAESDIRKKCFQIWEDLDTDQNFQGYDGTLIRDRVYHNVKLEESLQQPANRGLNKFLSIVSKVAAILFIPLVAFIYISRENFVPSKSEVSMMEIHSPPGTRTMFYLPDGSKGWLNGNSSLEFPTEFRRNERKVNLRGEAYFEVESDLKKQFIVSGPHVTVTSYGTSFNVLAYPDDLVSEITLASGHISVYGTANGKNYNSRSLHPNQMYIFDQNAYTSKTIPVDADQVIAWKDGKLIFRNEPMTDVVKRLSRWYNVDIIIRDEVLESYNYLATFEDETLEEILRLLQISAPIKYEDLGRERNNDGTFKNRKIYLYHKPKT